MIELKKPNDLLRRQRLLRGWSLDRLAEEIHRRGGGADATQIGKWERGIRKPRPYYQEMLIEIYGVTADGLGLVERYEEEKAQESTEDLDNIAPQSSHSTSPLIVLTEEQVRSLLVVLGETSMGDFDNARRELIKQFAIIIGSAFVAPKVIADPEPWKRLSHAVSKPHDTDLATLKHFARVTEGCWHITNGSEMAVVEQVLPTFLPKLAALTRQSSKHLPTVSGLTTQGYLLAGLVALDQFNLQEMETHSQLAVQYGQQYSELSHDYNLLAAALKQQATMFLITKKPSQALATYEKMLPFIKQVSPLLRSRIYSGLAGACARCGREQEALYYLGKAKETFPDRFEEDPSFLYADSGLSVLFMYEGLTYLDLDQPEPAWNAFTKVVDGENLQPQISIGELTHLEFINLLAKTTVASHDQERSRTYIEAAVNQSNVLHSQWGRSEAWDIYQTMRIVWPGDARVKALAEHFRFA